MKIKNYMAAILSLGLIAGCASPNAAPDQETKPGQTQEPASDSKDQNSSLSTENQAAPELLNAVAQAKGSEDALEAWQALLSKSIDSWSDNWSMDAETEVHSYNEQGTVNDANELMDISWDTSFVNDQGSVYEISISKRDSEQSDFTGGYALLNRYSANGADETTAELTADPDNALTGKVDNTEKTSVTAQQAMLSRLLLNTCEFGYGRQVSPVETPDLYEATVSETAGGYDLTFVLKNVEQAQKMDIGSMPSADATVPVVSFENVEAETLVCHFDKNLVLTGVNDQIIHAQISTDPGTMVTLITKADTDSHENDREFSVDALNQYFDSAVSNQPFTINELDD